MMLNNSIIGIYRNSLRSRQRDSIDLEYYPFKLKFIIFYKPKR